MGCWSCPAPPPGRRYGPAAGGHWIPPGDRAVCPSQAVRPVSASWKRSANDSVVAFGWRLMGEAGTLEVIQPEFILADEYLCF